MILYMKFITKNLEKIGHFHAAGNPGRHELTNGEINYRPILDIIKKAEFTGYLGLFFAGAVYASIGTFSSSLFDNQVIAFIIGVFIVLMFFLFDKLLIFVPAFMAGAIQYLSVDYHMSNMSRGVVDTRNVIYFISCLLIDDFLSA